MEGTAEVRKERKRSKEVSDGLIKVKEEAAGCSMFTIPLNLRSNQVEMHPFIFKSSTQVCTHLENAVQGIMMPDRKHLLT